MAQPNKKTKKTTRKKTAKEQPAQAKAPGSGIAIVCGLLVAIAVVGVAASYLPFVSDDALISLRYADRLIHGDGLTWNDGERVEGYSNLLWILLSALLGAVGFDLILATRILGFACTLAIVAALFLRYRPVSLAGSLPFLAAGLALALAGPSAVWTIGGLEQPLFAALFAWCALRMLRTGENTQGEPAAATPTERLPELATGLLLAALCWTRPDGVLLAATLLLGYALAFPRQGWRRIAIWGGYTLGAVALQTAFRLAYYGDWIPNTARAKVAFSSTRLTEGMEYVGGGLLGLVGLALPALGFAIAGMLDPSRARSTRMLGVPMLAWTAYVIVIGGDSFPAHRHLLILVVIFAFWIAEGFRALLAHSGAHYAAWALSLLSLVVLGVMQHRDPQNLRARHERWEWDGEVVGRMLRVGFPDRPLIAVDPAGTLPYFSGLPAIDMLGLSDPHLARNRPDDFGSGALGHELGDGAYVLDRKPDMIFFCGPGGGSKPCFRSGIEMVEDPRFTEEFGIVTLEGSQPHPMRSRVWMRREGGKVGIQRTESRIDVPAYFMMAINDQAAKLDPKGRLSIQVAAGAEAGLPELRLPAGHWSLQLDMLGEPPRLMTRLSGPQQMLGGGLGRVAFRLREEATIDVLVTPSGPEAKSWVHALVFQRLPD